MLHSSRPWLGGKAVSSRTRCWLAGPLVIGAVCLASASPVGAREAQTEQEPRGNPTAASTRESGASRQAEIRLVRFRWEEHPSLLIGRNTTVSVTARLESLGLRSDGETGEPTGFSLDRRRIGVEGRLLGDVEFQLERELVDEDPWRDVYVNYRRFDLVRVQAGKFKIPFSLEETTGRLNLDFAYRSMAANQLAPGRERGIMIHGRAFDAVRYEAGWFAGEGRNARVADADRVAGGETLAGRLSVQPFATAPRWIRDLQVGVAVADTTVAEGIAGLRGRTVFDGRLFPAYLWVNGARRRAGFEGRWRSGRFSLKGEYIRVSTERTGQSVENTDLPALVADGWYATTTWFVTGERKVDGGARPRRSVLDRGPGAIELAARVERIRFGSAVSPDGPPSESPRSPVVAANADRATTLGVNWYPLRGVKIQANIVRESIQDPERGPSPGRRAFWSRVLRILLTV